MLFSQDSDSLIKVLASSINWHFSQQSHPPAFDHKGHYLSTVVAQGNPTIVKPILIDRYVIISNAFEHII